jgi:small GTP-binding protein
MSTSLKLVLLGDGGTGKTSWVAALRGTPVSRQYLPTLGAEIHPITFEYQDLMRQLNIWDTAGQEKYAGLRDGYYISGDIAIVAFDMHSSITYKNVPLWVGDVRRVCGSIPLCVVGMKADEGIDCRASEWCQDTTAFLEAQEIPVFTLRAITGRGLLDPLHSLMQRVVSKGASAKEGQGGEGALPSKSE